MDPETFPGWRLARSSGRLDWHHYPLVRAQLPLPVHAEGDPSREARGASWSWDFVALSRERMLRG